MSAGTAGVMSMLLHSSIQSHQTISSSTADEDQDTCNTKTERFLFLKHVRSKKSPFIVRKIERSTQPMVMQVLSSRFDFFAFFASVASILRDVLTNQSHRTSERQNREWRSSSSSTSSRSTKHTEFTEIGGLLFNMGL